ncbi:hypothetical protein M7I_6860 [Glarea lozoyensis 74030]|uniref:Uncharacterized protein n=1 Tax=Glarea lozoyensis (strain ATCC 74030 / MF5533) TaxID=1104152 RepID=H0EVQ8_GLAL7|nr:hypothetical protein M7I_6860 [Glarea lozoyensis 74030]
MSAGGFLTTIHSITDVAAAKAYLSYLLTSAGLPIGIPRASLSQAFISSTHTA